MNLTSLKPTILFIIHCTICKGFQYHSMNSIGRGVQQSGKSANLSLEKKFPISRSRTSWIVALRLTDMPVEQNGDNSNGSNGKRAVIRRLILSFVTLMKQLKLIFMKLNKRTRAFLALNFTLFTLIFGKGVYRKATSGASPNHPPVEITWSYFMDLCEQKDAKQAVNIKGPVLVQDDRVSFLVEPTAEAIAQAQEQQQQTVVQKPKRTGLMSFKGRKRSGITSGKPLRVYARKPRADPTLLKFLREQGLSFTAGPIRASKKIAAMVQLSILGLYMGVIFRMYNSASGRGGFKGANKIAQDPKNVVKFEEIEGIDSAKFEVMELVDTLLHPGKYAILGARAPKGVLLCGPPGTGKTMLAKAVASTVGVPLLYCSGSDFVEMYVGRGAARVRQTFEKASKLAPCIIFIDELDALGKKRNMELDMLRGSNDEAEQTLNQMLACMDGLDTTKGVCVLAATNRQDVLDSALTRPGRFDRIVQVPLPDAKGREAILRVHASKLPGFTEVTGVDKNRPGSLGLGNAVDLSAVAAVTPGLAGAELDYIVNEAAIRAVRRVSKAVREGTDPKVIGSPHVNAKDFEESVQNFFSTRGKKFAMPNIFK